MSFQVIAPFSMQINADTYIEAVKQAVKFHRDMSINQLIIQDQLSNNRMLANIKYYTDNNKNKFKANLVPTELTTLHGGHPHRGSGPPGWHRGGLGDPVWMRQPHQMIIPVRLPFPTVTPQHTKTFLAPGTAIVANTSIGPTFIKPQGSVFADGTVITAADTFPLGTVITPGTSIRGSIHIQRTEVGSPFNGEIRVLADVNVGAAANQNVGGVDLTFAAATTLKAGCIFPAGTVISAGCIIVPGTEFRYGTVVPLGTNIPDHTILPAATIIVAGTNMPPGTTITLPVGFLLKDDCTCTPPTVPPPIFAPNFAPGYGRGPGMRFP